MNLKDKIILIFYIGTKGRTRKESIERMIDARCATEHLFDESSELFIIPDSSRDDVDVKCINPRFVTEEEYKEVEKVINELKEKLKQ